MNSTDRLIHMANQIATNLATEADSVSAILNHIQLFWDPRMKQMIIDHNREGLCPTASAAIVELAKTRPLFDHICTP